MPWNPRIQPPCAARLGIEDSLSTATGVPTGMIGRGTWKKAEAIPKNSVNILSSDKIFFALRHGWAKGRRLNSHGPILQYRRARTIFIPYFAPNLPATLIQSFIPGFFSPSSSSFSRWKKKARRVLHILDSWQNCFGDDVDEYLHVSRYDLIKFYNYYKFRVRNSENIFRP